MVVHGDGDQVIHDDDALLAAARHQRHHVLARHLAVLHQRLAVGRAAQLAGGGDEREARGHVAVVERALDHHLVPRLWRQQRRALE